MLRVSFSQFPVFLKSQESTVWLTVLYFVYTAAEDGKPSSSKATPGISVPGIPYNRIDCHTFFSDRNEVVEKAFEDCQRDLLSSTEEDELLGTWLLTE